jgi:hypothetical protein
MRPASRLLCLGRLPRFWVCEHVHIVNCPLWQQWHRFIRLQSHLDHCVSNCIYLHIHLGCLHGLGARKDPFQELSVARWTYLSSQECKSLNIHSPLFHAHHIISIVVLFCID